MPFHCSTCGGEHDGVPHIGNHYPDAYFDIPEDERTGRAEWTPDTCVIRYPDGLSHYFVRGAILLPVHDQPADTFGFGVWASLCRKDFEEYVSGAAQNPMLGCLCTDLHCYHEATTALHVVVHPQAEGKRPLIDVELADHPLARDQRDGITLDRAWEMVHHYLG